MKFKLWLLAILPLPFLLACQTTKNVQLIGQLAVQEITAIGIQSGCSDTACYDRHAAHVLVIAQTFQNVTPGMLVADVQKLVDQEIAKLHLSPAEAAPLAIASQSLMAYLTPFVGSSVLSNAGVLFVQQAAGWVAAECELYSPPLKAQVLKMAEARHNKKK